MYSFDGVELPYVQSAIIPLASRIPSADTPAHAGGYAGTRKAATRTATIVGTLKSNDFESLKSDWAALLAAHDAETARALVVRDGWFYYAQCESLTESEVEATNLQYQADYRLSDPHAYSLTVSTQSLAASGATVFSVGGSKPALPTISLFVSAAPTGGSIEVHNQTTNQKTIIYPASAQEYRFNSRAESMEAGAMSAFSGQFLSLAVGDNTITITPAGGAALSSASVSWRNRSL